TTVHRATRTVRACRLMGAILATEILLPDYCSEPRFPSDKPWRPCSRDTTWPPPTPSCTTSARPEDDAPRLIFADWIEENGEGNRAEFIRLQCRLATLPEDDPARPDLLDREWELLAVYRGRWGPGKDSPFAKHLYESGFLRGFFARARVPAAVLLEHGDEL